MPGDELAPSVTHLHPRCSCLGTSEDSALLQTRTTLSDVPLPGLEDTPLVLHAGYGIREVLTAAGWLTATRRTPLRAGVLALAARKTELLFVSECQALVATCGCDLHGLLAQVLGGFVRDQEYANTAWLISNKAALLGTGEAFVHADSAALTADAYNVSLPKSGLRA